MAHGEERLTVAQAVLKENVARCREHDAEKRKPLRDVGKASTVGRVARGNANPSLKTLEAIAAKFGLEVWQLLYPGLDPGNKPVALSAKEQKLYKRFQQSARELVEQDEKTVERAARSAKVERLVGKYEKSTLFPHDDGGLK